MHGNWAKEETTTTGTGTLTLSAVTGWPRFADVFPVGEEVSYAILNSDGSPIEAGIGTVAASNTLERTQIDATYVSGAYDNTNASAVSLASGTKTVIATPVARSILGAGTLVNANATLRAIGSAHYMSSSSSTVSLGSANRCYYMPFLLEFGVEITGLVVNVTTAVASSNFRIGLYWLASNGAPGAKWLETADLSGATTGIKGTGSITRIFAPPGWYYAAIAAKAAAISVDGNRMEGISTPLGHSTVSATYAQGYETLSGGWTDLPTAAATSLTLSTGAAGFSPRVVLEVA